MPSYYSDIFDHFLECIILHNIYLNEQQWLLIVSRSNPTFIPNFIKFLQNYPDFQFPPSFYNKLFSLAFRTSVIDNNIKIEALKFYKAFVAQCIKNYSKIDKNDDDTDDVSNNLNPDLFLSPSILDCFDKNAILDVDRVYPLLFHPNGDLICNLPNFCYDVLICSFLKQEHFQGAFNLVKNAIYDPYAILHPRDISQISFICPIEEDEKLKTLDELRNLFQKRWNEFSTFYARDRAITDDVSEDPLIIFQKRVVAARQLDVPVLDPNDSKHKYKVNIPSPPIPVAVYQSKLYKNKMSSKDKNILDESKETPKNYTYFGLSQADYDENTTHKLQIVNDKE